jgi:diguanylate cyclase (GGDEF)-like protein
MERERVSKPPSTLFLMVIGIAITIGFSGISGSIFREMGQREYDHAYQAGTNLVASLSSHIDRNIELYDLSLRQLIQAYGNSSVRQLDPETRQLALFDGSSAAKNLGSMQVIDATGRVVMDSNTTTPPNTDYSAHDFFRVHQTNPNAGLFISHPWISEDGQYAISLSRRMANADGSFAGIVVGRMSLAYFHDLFRKLNLGADDSIALVGTDGCVLMRYPFDIDLIGRNIARSTVFEHLRNASSGWYRSPSWLDGHERLFVYQQVGLRPLLIAQGTSTQTIFASWWREVWLLASVLVVLTMLTLALIFSLATALKRRHAAEARLAVLAATDGLTGLSNRRRFDDMLEKEWRRALRSRTSLALILVDVDHFKSYNDLFGHQAGDRALATVASCMVECATRGGDLCARYGGEEFAVLLPGDDIHGAMRVAEKIRTRVFSLRAASSEGSDRIPTVSLGVASMIPQPELSSGDLIKSADLALYDAKRDGRNRTVRASVLPFPRRRAALGAAG